MKKYFIEGTEEEVVFGDAIELDFTKEVKYGRIKAKQTVTLDDSSLEWLLKIGIVEEREVEEEDEGTSDEVMIDFIDEEPCEVLETLVRDFENLEKRVDKQEELTVGVLKEMMVFVKGLIKDAEDKEEKKPAQPKKK